MRFGRPARSVERICEGAPPSYAAPAKVAKGDRRGYAAEYHHEIARGDTWWEDGIGWVGRALSVAAE